MTTALLRGIHHSAYRCRDAEETRAFYEELLGLPLAGLVIADTEPGSGRRNPFVHIFFALGDGNFIAFFDNPGSATPEHFNMVHGFDRHVAFEVSDEAALRDFLARVRAAGPMARLAGLAGALRLADLPRVRALAPDFAGFRSAVCSGDRGGALDPARLRALHQAMHTEGQLLPPPASHRAWPQT